MGFQKEKEKVSRMELSQETEDFLRESVEYTLGLPVSTRTLQLKLRASEEAQHHLRNQYLSLQSKIKEKEEIIERARVRNEFPLIL